MKASDTACPHNRRSRSSALPRQAVRLERYSCLGTVSEDAEMVSNYQPSGDPNSICGALPGTRIPFSYLPKRPSTWRFRDGADEAGF